jgi:hypothetical protein
MSPALLIPELKGGVMPPFLCQLSARLPACYPSRLANELHNIIESAF